MLTFAAESGQEYSASGVSAVSRRAVSDDTRVVFRLDFSGRHAIDRAAAVEAVLRLTPSDDHAALARLEAILAATRVVLDPEQAAAAAERSRAHAVAADDEVSRAWALLARCAVDLSPDALENRLADAREVVSIACRTGQTEFLVSGFFLMLAGLAEQGAIAELDEELSATGPTLAAFPHLAEGRHVAWFRCMRATLDGQAQLAERLAAEGHAIARSAGDPDADSVFSGQLAIVRWMQGRSVELEPAFLHGRQAFPGELVWAVSLAWVWVRQGRDEAARGLIGSLAPLTSFPRDRNWLAAVSILGIVVAELGERELAAEVRTLLLPFEHRLATIGLGVTCWGTVARPLALIARMLGDDSAAIAHYRAAIAVSARVGAQAWLAEAQWELAALLAEQHPPAIEEALGLAAQAAAAGRILQLHGVEDAAAEVVASLEARSQVREEPASPQPKHPSIRVLGGFEVVSVGGDHARWQSRKARELLKILVARRGVAIERETLMDLLWPDEAPEELANRFSVAATAVRRALDPKRSAAQDAFLQTDGNLVRLSLDNVHVDVEHFLREVDAALSAELSAQDRLERLTRILDDYRGDALPDEPHALWAERLRRQVHLAFFAASHAAADAAEELGDQLARVGAYRGILAVDEYDQRAHTGLIDALSMLGAPGQASDARVEYERCMAELGVVPDPI